jgi:tagatose-1,6-bisphosphate aldolase non-catalytic subunit AgaZ/GatZ
MSDSWGVFIKDLSCYRYEINGHSTDFTRTGRYLIETVKGQFPINEVPPNIAAALKELNTRLEIAEDTYEQTVDLIIAEVKKQQFPNQTPPKIFDEHDGAN